MWVVINLASAASFAKTVGGNWSPQCVLLQSCMQVGSCAVSGSCGHEQVAALATRMLVMHKNAMG